MALAAAGIVLEPQSPFAAERRRLCLLTIAVTLLFGVAAPGLSSLPAHAAGAIAGFLLTFVLPAPLRRRARREAESAANLEKWAELRASITAAPPEERQLELRPTRVWLGGLTLAAVFTIGLGASTALQALAVADPVSSVIAVAEGVLTALGGLFVVIYESRHRFQAGPGGLTGFRWGREVSWTEVEMFFPGSVHFGLFAHEAVGCVLIDGYAFGIPAMGHPVETIARRLEAFRLALAGPAATAPDSPG